MPLVCILTLLLTLTRTPYQPSCAVRAEAVEAVGAASPAADFFDAATRTFWRNVQARSTGAQPPPLGRRPARWALPEEVRIAALLDVRNR